MESVARSLEDSRRQASCDHRLVDLLRQRVYALVLGHEDLNDHGELRHDLALQTAAGPLGDQCLTLQTGNFYFGTSGYYSSGTDRPDFD